MAYIGSDKPAVDDVLIAIPLFFLGSSLCSGCLHLEVECELAIILDDLAGFPERLPYCLIVHADGFRLLLLSLLQLSLKL